MERLLLHRAAPAFHDRREAGRRLGERLREFAGESPIVIGLPRGGVPVAFEVARALHAPLDVVLVRKIGCPFQPELGVGAIGEDDSLLIEPAVLSALGLTMADLAPTVERERAVLAERRTRYRGGRDPLSVAGRTVVLVDDGIATGGTARVGARVLRTRGASRVVLGVPVGPPGVETRLQDAVDEVVCLEQPADYFAVGQAYEQFAPTSDEEVGELLDAATQGRAPRVARIDPPQHAASAGGVAWSGIGRREVVIDADGVALAGDLRLPARALGLVLFAHGSGSSRLSPRNVRVAVALNGHAFATLLFDLLSFEQGLDRRRVFDIALLAERLLAATSWAGCEPDVAQLPVGYFGASTGAAAALTAAAQRPESVSAVVSRGGRPDLAEPWLERVLAPTLLIIGGADLQVLELNRRAAERLRCAHELAIVPQATHLFEEPGALEHVTDLTAAWFAQHLGGAQP